MQESLENSFIAPVTVATFSEVKKIERLGQKKPWSDESLLAELADANAFHFGCFALADHCLSAILLARTILDELQIHHLCTHPDYRRRGLAGSLLHHVLKASCSRGIKKAFLEVAASNEAAIALYNAKGFTIDFIRKKYYSTGDDALVMSKGLIEKKGHDT